MKETKYSKKIDSMGRITIPARLRDQMGMMPGQEYQFFTHEEGDQFYICIGCPDYVPNRLEEARTFLERLGYKIIKEDEPAAND